MSLRQERKGASCVAWDWQGCLLLIESQPMSQNFLEFDQLSTLTAAAMADTVQRYGGTIRRLQLSAWISTKARGCLHASTRPAGNGQRPLQADLTHSQRNGVSSFLE
jgi:hypothetical protein